jgi:predicted enzyme related to lactoylglutathione lyase
VGSTDDQSDRVFRLGGLSYIRIPAPDPERSARFYQAVFAWKVDIDREHPSFEDGTGHVIGHLMPGLSVVGEAGVVPYIYVDSVDDAIRKVIAAGGEVVAEPYPEGDLWVATFHDPARNVVGLWHRGPR